MVNKVLFLFFVPLESFIGKGSPKMKINGEERRGKRKVLPPKGVKMLF